jgi:hypothetical protein
MASSVLTRAALTATAALAATGCGFPHTFVGTVTALPADCGPRPGAAGPPAALPGATVTARCPGSPSPVLLGVADARGHLRTQLERPLSLSCELVVAKDGYAPRAYALKDACAEPRTATCEAVTLSARLLALRESGRAP